MWCLMAPQQFLAKMNNTKLEGKSGAGQICPFLTRQFFFLEKSSLNSRHVELLYNIVSRWFTQAGVCVRAHECICEGICKRSAVNPTLQESPTFCLSDWPFVNECTCDFDIHATMSTGRFYFQNSLYLMCKWKQHAISESNKQLKGLYYLLNIFCLCMFVFSFWFIV